ncbi:MAG: isoprenylcysteine carboxylmethyltransferase family protein [Acidobacteriota bacterium]
MTTFERVFVWLGGGLFVAALTACAHAYLFVWATPAPDGGGWALAVDAVLFGVFALHHSVLARDPVKHKMERLIPARLLRSSYVWFASLLLIGVVSFWQRVAGSLYEVAGWRAAPHVLVQLTGVWLIARSVRTIDPLELAGITLPADNDGLQVAGPYRWVRHPLYLGWILALFGAAHMTVDRFAFAAISTAYLFAAIPWEERSLVRAFGESYLRYQREVRWRVLPYIY